MDELSEWERVLMAPYPPPEPRPVPLYVNASDLKAGMRVCNGLDPYMVVYSTRTIPATATDPELTEVSVTVGGRAYRSRWEPDDRMPVVTPSIYVQDAH